MRVLIINMRQLIVGIIVLLVILIGGVVLLASDPLSVSDSYRPDAESVFTSAPVSVDEFNTAKPELALDVTVEGTTANVKMLTKNFEFLPLNSEMTDHTMHGQGHAHVYLDGQLKGKVDEAEFLLKQLPKGEHELRVELTYHNHLPYKVEQVRMIEIK